KLQNLAAAAIAAALLSAATGASAQTISGICVLDQNGVLAGSVVGKYVNERMKELGATASAELQADATALQTDEKTFETQRATLSSEAANQQAAALQGREAALQQKYQLRQREMQATGQKAV